MDRPGLLDRRLLDLCRRDDRRLARQLDRRGDRRLGARRPPRRRGRSRLANPFTRRLPSEWRAWTSCCGNSSEAERDAGCLRLVLIGSHARGTPDAESDVDILYVLPDEKRERERRGKLELIPVTLADFREPPEWFEPALAHARVVLDKAGELAPVVEQARRVSREEAEEAYAATSTTSTARSRPGAAATSWPAASKGWSRSSTSSSFCTRSTAAARRTRTHGRARSGSLSR